MIVIYENMIINFDMVESIKVIDNMLIFGYDYNFERITYSTEDIAKSSLDKIISFYENGSKVCRI